MYSRLLTLGVLSVALVMLTDTRSQADCDDDDDGCCVRVCRPCRPCPQPSCCAPVPLNTCVCPYYEMGGMWYAEQFTIPTGNCMNGTPVAWPNGPASYCSGDDCGCGLMYSPCPGKFTCPYLPKCVESILSDPPPPDPHSGCQVEKQAGPFYLKIKSIDQVAQSDTYVIYWHMVTKADKKPAVPFWIGWQCTTPNPLPHIEVDAQSICGPDSHAVVLAPHAGPGGGEQKKILIRLTKNGCSP